DLSSISFFFSSRRRHTRFSRDWSSDVCSSDLQQLEADGRNPGQVALEMNQKFQDDVPLHRLALGGQMAMLSDIYQSDECQALYKIGRASCRERVWITGVAV